VKVLVMAKAPLPGRVKTRLCPPLTPEQACEVAEAALADTLDAVAACGADEGVIALDGAPGPWLPPGFRIVRQEGTTFADRLARAWHDCGGPALQIGMDTPQADSALLDSSLSALDASPRGCVIGLAHDGGWWAIGLREPQPDVFQGVPMSTPATGAHQIARLRLLGLEPAHLRPLVDVDTWSEARAVASEVPLGRFAARVRAIEAGAAELRAGSQ
jgi:glycosyltransferase A (GT-A) superfamily protein (DUF2064 family)